MILLLRLCMNLSGTNTAIGMWSYQKPVLWNEDENPDAAATTRRVLLSVLEGSLRLLHPFMPFITEEIWQKLAPQLNLSGDSIMLQPYPKYDANVVDENAEEHIDWLKGIIVAIRTIRSEVDVPPSKSINVLLNAGLEEDRIKLQNYRHYLQKLAKLDSIEWLKNDSESPAAATALVGEIEVLVPLAGLIDVDAERNRLNKEIAKLAGALKGVDAKAL